MKKDNERGPNCSGVIMAMNLQSAFTCMRCNLIRFLLGLGLLLAFILSAVLLPPPAKWYLIYLAIFVLFLLLVIWLCYSAECINPEKLGGKKLQTDDESPKKDSHIPIAESVDPEKVGGAQHQIDHEFLKEVSHAPILFNYRDLRDATDNFAKEIGKGGCGSVFQGIVRDGRRVAVKRLDNPDKGIEQFRAEVTALASLNHSNLVRLYGLCIEGPHPLLVYEYMENGSLHDWLFDPQRKPLDWMIRRRIALQTARGLAYLHEDCNSRILHLDVKPQNILLDQNFNAKVSDFGLARLLNKDQSHVLTQSVRGTLGYIAPDYFSDLVLTAKTDVYSYGIVLLEMVSGRKVLDSSHDSNRRCLPDVALGKAREGKFEELYDSRLEVSEETEAEMKKVINLGLRCIQKDPELRPSISRVVQILDGSEMVDPPLDCSVPFGPSFDDDHCILFTGQSLFSFPWG